MKYIIIIILIITSGKGFAQEKISIDSLWQFIMNNSATSQFQRENQFSEVKNTKVGMVLYDGLTHLVKFNENSDTPSELDGFEIYYWEIITKDTLEAKTIRLKGIYPPGRGENYAIFTFTDIGSGLILYKRTIFNKEGEELMSFQKVITENINMNKFVCLRDPNPE